MIFCVITSVLCLAFNLMSASSQRAIHWNPSHLFHHTCACSLKAWRMKPGRSIEVLSSFAPVSDISSDSGCWGYTTLFAISWTTTSFTIPHWLRVCSSLSIRPLNNNHCHSSGTSIVSQMLSFKLPMVLVLVSSNSVSWSSMVLIRSLTITDSCEGLSLLLVLAPSFYYDGEVCDSWPSILLKV